MAHDLALVKRTIRAATRFCNRRAWRRAATLRASKIAIVLRAIERVLGRGFVRRERGRNRVWSFFARDAEGREVVVVQATVGASRKLEQLRAPIMVNVFAPSLIDLAALQDATGGVIRANQPE